MSFFFFQAEDGIRDYKVTGVQTCALPICAGRWIRRAWRGSLPRLAAASLLLVALVAGCRTAPALDPARLLALEPELGQLLLVGFQGTELEGNAPLEALLCEARGGGAVLFARNIVDAEQLPRLTAALQARARACTGRTLLVAVDAEGGQVMRLAPRAGFTGTLSAQELGETNDFTLTELEAR